MYSPLTNQFLNSLREASQIKTVVDLYYNYAPTPVITDLPVISGSITVDRNSTNRRSGSIVIGDASLLTAEVGLAPYGVELVIRQGFVYADRTEELIPLGVFPIETVEWQEESGDIPTVTFFDRSQTISRADFLAPVDKSGVFSKKVINDLIKEVLPNVTVTFADGITDVKLPGGTIYNTGRWDAITSLANGMGAEVYFDVTGNVVVVPTINPNDANVDPADLVVADIDAGENGVLISASRALTRNGTYNAVAVTGVAPSDTSPVPIGYAYDLDPSSKTFYNGPFGKAVLQVTNEALTTVSQCTIQARKILADNLGLAQSLAFSSLPNPAFDAGDFIRVTYLDGSSSIHILDTLTISLGGAEANTATTRSTTKRSTPTAICVPQDVSH